MMLFQFRQVNELRKEVIALYHLKHGMAKNQKAQQSQHHNAIPPGE